MHIHNQFTWCFRLSLFCLASVVALVNKLTVTGWLAEPPELSALVDNEREREKDKERDRERERGEEKGGEYLGAYVYVYVSLSLSVNT